MANRALLVAAIACFLLLFSATATAISSITDPRMCKSPPNDNYCDYSNGYFDPQDTIYTFFRTWDVTHGGCLNLRQTATIQDPFGRSSSIPWALSRCEGNYWYYWWYWYFYGGTWNGRSTFYPGQYTITINVQDLMAGNSRSVSFSPVVRGLETNSVSTCSSQASGDSCATNNGHYRTTDTVWLFFRTWYVNHKDTCYDLKIKADIYTPWGAVWSGSSYEWYKSGCDGNYDYRWWYWYFGGSGYVWTPGTYRAHFTITDRKVYNYEKSFDVYWTIDAPDCSYLNGCLDSNTLRKNCRYDSGQRKCVCDTVARPANGYYCADSDTRQNRNYFCSGSQFQFSTLSSEKCSSRNGAGTSYFCSGDNLFKRTYSQAYSCSNGNNQNPGATCTLNSGSYDTSSFVEACSSHDGWYCAADGSREYRDYGCSAGNCAYSVTNRGTCRLGCSYLSGSAVCNELQLVAGTSKDVKLGGSLNVTVNYSSIGIPSGNVKFVADVTQQTPQGCYKLWCADPAADTECPGRCLDGQSWTAYITSNTKGSLRLPLGIGSDGLTGAYAVKVSAYDAANRLLGSATSSITVLANSLRPAPTNGTIFDPLGIILSANGAGSPFQPMLGINGEAAARLPETANMGNLALAGLAGMAAIGAAGAAAYLLYKRRDANDELIPEGVEWLAGAGVGPIPYVPKQDIVLPQPVTYVGAVPQPEGTYSGVYTAPGRYDDSRYNLNLGSPAAIPPALPVPWMSRGDPYPSGFYQMVDDEIDAQLAAGLPIGSLTARLTSMYSISSGWLAGRVQERLALLAPKPSGNSVQYEKNPAMAWKNDDDESQATYPDFSNVVMVGSGYDEGFLQRLEQDIYATPDGAMSEEEAGLYAVALASELGAIDRLMAPWLAEKKRIESQRYLTVTISWNESQVNSTLADYEKKRQRILKALNELTYKRDANQRWVQPLTDIAVIAAVVATVLSPIPGDEAAALSIAASRFAFMAGVPVAAYYANDAYKQGDTLGIGLNIFLGLVPDGIYLRSLRGVKAFLRLGGASDELLKRLATRGLLAEADFDALRLALNEKRLTGEQAQMLLQLADETGAPVGRLVGLTKFGTIEKIGGKLYLRASESTLNIFRKPFNAGGKVSRFSETTLEHFTEELRPGVILDNGLPDTRLNEIKQASGLKTDAEVSSAIQETLSAGTPQPYDLQTINYVREYEWGRMTVGVDKNTGVIKTVIPASG